MKKLPIASGGWGAQTQDPCLWYVWVTLVSLPRFHKLTHILKTLTFGSSPSSPSSLATSCLRTNPCPRLVIFLSKVFLSHKKSLLLKIYDDVVLYVVFELEPNPIRNLEYAYARIQKVFMFFFQPIKNNAVLDPRTEHFWGLVGFETKAKPKHFKMCPRGQIHPSGLLFC